MRVPDGDASLAALTGQAGWRLQQRGRGERHSQASVFAVVPIMLLLMLGLLIVQLHSFARLFIRHEYASHRMSVYIGGCRDTDVRPLDCLRAPNVCR